MQTNLLDIVSMFEISGSVTGIEKYGSGHINDSFLVRTREKNEPNYFLQRVNHHVFRNVPELMSNIERITSHIQRKREKNPGKYSLQNFLTFITAKNGQLFYRDTHDNFWRLSVFIENSKMYDVVDSPDKAWKGGRAFGEFLTLLEDFDPFLLYDSIPNFHNMKQRLENFKKIVARDRVGRAKAVKQEIQFVENRKSEMLTIHKLGAAGEIPFRVTHNDTKFNNILFDENDEVICVTDLDTVMKGYVHSDFGDAIRTVANSAPEDERDLNKIHLHLELYRAFARGFLEETIEFLTPTEVTYLPYSAKMMTFMQGIRFLTDYLDGDKYYKILHEEHNLQRTRSQFKLVEEMEKHEREMTDFVEKFVKNSGELLSTNISK